MRTSFHHQPEAQHPNFPLSTSRQADYPIFGLCALKADISEVRDVLRPDKLKTLMVSRDLPRHAMLALAALKA